MKFRLPGRIKEEPIELDIRAEIAFHNPRYRWRRWLPQMRLRNFSGPALAAEPSIVSPHGTVRPRRKIQEADEVRLL